jgi:hypothetical protein
MSTFSDNFVIVKLANDDGMFGSCENKTEFLTILNDQYKQKVGKDVRREFSNEIEFTYDAKKGKVKKVHFSKNDAVETLLDSSRSDFTVITQSGLPGNSQPKGRSTQKRMSSK